MTNTMNATGPRFYEIGEVVDIRGTAHIFEACGRCLGSGRYSYNPMHGDTCFGCGGRRGKLVDKAESERLAANRVKAAAARARKAERDAIAFAAQADARWARLVDGHPLLVELSYRCNVNIGHGYGDILGELLGKFERYGNLSDKQIAFAEKLIVEGMADQVRAEERARERAAKAAARVNAAIGEKGDRITFTGTVRYSQWYANDYSGYTVLIFDTPDGTVKWLASGDWSEGPPVGCTTTIKATVKDHDIHEATQEITTIVTRGKVQ